MNPPPVPKGKGEGEGAKREGVGQWAATIIVAGWQPLTVIKKMIRHNILIIFYMTVNTEQG